MDMLDQTMDYKDEHFDFIQQMLRCICMKCKYILLLLFF